MLLLLKLLLLLLLLLLLPITYYQYYYVQAAPEISQADLAPLLLQLAAWGGGVSDAQVLELGLGPPQLLPSP